ncbi:MAG: tyrosine-type recombinase/integrase [Lachnospiraceae bacterium]|nr:tyrosine-type recombinase/integrase [Lachnospiraceae bacterium]
MDAHDYQSHFSVYICGMLDARKTLGYVIEPHASLLKSFDQYCIRHYPDETVLTEYLVMSWVIREGKINTGTSSRAAAIRLLAVYIKLSGQDAYILPDRYFGKDRPRDRYIFSDDELAALFAQIDAMAESQKVPHSQLILPVLFRLIYTCGLRPKEGRELERRYINLDTGEILITNTKKKRERIVVMSDDMTALCHRYDQMRQFFYPDNPYFFPGSETGPIDEKWLNRSFSRCWKKVRPDLSEKDWPRVTIYNLRHRFATYNVNRWLDEGKDMNAMLPRLRAYMGHYSLVETAYYIHLLPENLLKNKGIDWASFADIIPEVVPWEG